MNSSALYVPVRSLRPIRPFAIAAVILITAVSVSSAGLSAAQLLYQDSWAWQETYGWRDMHMLLRAGLMLLHLPAGIAFICWLFRARANAHAISPEVLHTYNAPLMVVGWLVPVINLFVPKGVVDDIWATSRPGGLRPGADLYRIRRSGLIWTWWLSWLLSDCSHLAVAYLPRTDAGALETAILIIDIGLSIVAGLLAARVVLTITGLQEVARAGGGPASTQFSSGPGALGPDRAPYLGLVSLAVRDYDEALAFYLGVLGFELLEDTSLGDGGRRVTVRPPGSRETAVLLTRVTALDHEAPSGDRAESGPGLFLCTDDLTRDHGRMRSAGIVFDEVPRQEPHGMAVAFRDPYGNRWELLQPAVSPMRG